MFIVGGGPAGLSAAIALRSRGLSVTVADSRQPSIDKTCGEGIMPDGADAAGQLGIDFSSVASARVRGIRLLSGDVAVESPFPKTCGYGVRRTALHALLIDKTVQSGVEIHWNAPVSSLDGIGARWIVGADGAGSRVREWSGLNRLASNSSRFGFTRHYKMEPWTDYIEGHYADGMQLFVTPLGPDQVGLAMLSRNSKWRMTDALKRFPAVKEKLGAAAPVSPERGAATVSRRLRRVTSGNVALIGDASGSVDAITAAGLSLNFREALALADAIEAEDLPRYEVAHRRLERRPRMMARLMLSIDRSPLLRKYAFQSMSACPGIFRSLVAVHVRA